MYAAGGREDEGRGGARWNYLSLITVSYRSGKCEEIKYWDKISDMKLNTRKQLIVSQYIGHGYLLGHNVSITLLVVLQVLIAIPP